MRFNRMGSTVPSYGFTSMMSSRYVIFSLGAWIMLVWGTMYSFPVWLPRIKAEFHLSQVQTDIMGAGVYVGSNLIGMPLGALLTTWTSRCQKITSYLLLALAPTGYLLLYVAFVSNKVVEEMHSMMLLGGAILLVGVSVGTSYAAVAPMVLRQFPPDRLEAVIGWLSTLFALGGLGASFLSALMSLERFVIVLAIAHVVTGMVSLPLMQHLSAASTSPFPPTHETSPFPPTHEPLLASPIAEPADRTTDPLDYPNSDATETPYQTYSHLVRQWTFWLTCVAMFCTIGVGSSFTANIGSMVNAVDGPEAVNRAGQLVGLFNGVQMGGRTVASLLCSMWKDLVFPLSVCILVGYLTVALLSVWFLSAATVPYLVCLFGLPYGIMWCITAAWNQFTTRSHALHWSIVMNLVMMPLGGAGALVANGLVGHLYDRLANPVTHMCYYTSLNEKEASSNCFGEGFLFMAGGSLVALVALCLLQYARRGRSPQQQGEVVP